MAREHDAAEEEFLQLLKELAKNLQAYRPQHLIPPGYHPDFADLELFRKAGWRCEHCKQPFFSIAFGKKGTPYIKYPQRAHDHASHPSDPSPKLHALCCTCHLIYDNQQPGGRRKKEG